MDIIEQLKEIEEKIHQEIEEASSLKELQDIQVHYLGKKGPITEALRQMKVLSKDERPKVGAYANQLKQDVATRLENKKEDLTQKEEQEKLIAEKLDVTLPGREVKRGSEHVLQIGADEIIDLFLSMGFEWVDGPEVETDYYNFQRLNLPEDHPARDMHDSFYITDKTLLRTHTSPVEARTMDAHDFSKGPLKMVSVGKVYRRDDDDATHSHQFTQIEGMIVGKHVTMADLKGVLELFAKRMFGEDQKIRLRPSYFPFTEPSVEVDIVCFNCKGKGCSICKYTGWIEVLGAGMTHPNVLEMDGLDPNEYSGFAFGLGLDRVTMLRYGITDIRHLYQNDLRFNHQFVERGN